jgi:DNA-binding NarL/FixJ family response regulator
MTARGRRTDATPSGALGLNGPTARELEVFFAFRRWHSRKLAAAELGISDGTAATHLKRLYRKRPDLRAYPQKARIYPQKGPLAGSFAD